MEKGGNAQRGAFMLNRGKRRKPQKEARQACRTVVRGAERAKPRPEPLAAPMRRDAPIKHGVAVMQ